MPVPYFFNRETKLMMMKRLLNTLSTQTQTIRKWQPPLFTIFIFNLAEAMCKLDAINYLEIQF